MGSNQLTSIVDAADDEKLAPQWVKPHQGSYGYDAAGNMTGDAERTLAYNALNLPSQITAPEAAQRMSYLNGTVFARKDQENKTRYYLGGLEVYDGTIESYQFGDGRLAFRDGTPHFQYRISDHLGNTVVLFEDKNDDGLILDAPEDPANSEVLQRKLYYPFGMELRGTSPVQPAVAERYGYNGKEEVEGTGLYAYGFRFYDPVIGRFTGVDPIADRFAFVSAYNYAENEPIGSIDLHGLQRLRVTTPRSPRSRNSRTTVSFPVTELPNTLTHVGASARHPSAALSVGSVKRNSTNISSVAGRFARHIDEDAGLGGVRLGGNTNAIRHGIWSAAIQQRFGGAVATDVTNAHEGIAVTQSADIDFSQSFEGGLDIADSTVDFLNNQIGMAIGAANPDASVRELAGLVVDTFADIGLWTATTDDNGNVTISRTKISDKQRNQAHEAISRLGGSGFTPEEFNAWMQELQNEPD